MQLPRRVFLDTNVVNFILDHGGSIFEGEPPENHLSERDLADIKALHFVFLTGERAHWELAVSPLTYQEISALRHFVWNTTISFSQRRCERMGGQVLELGHAQVGDADEVGRGSVAPCGAFGLLQ